APLHLQRALLPGERHAIDAAVASRAADALVHVNAVIEVDELGEVMDPRPLDGLPALEARSHRLEHRTVCPNLRMTVHAGLGRRDSRERGGLDRGVTVAAVEALAPDVVLVTERYWLLPCDARLSDVRRSADGVEQPTERRQEEDRAENAHARDCVRAAVED